MSTKAAITVARPRDEVERRWREAEHEELAGGAQVTFRDAPGDRGTEIHVEVDAGGRLGQAVGKLTGSDPVAKAKDELRRFKQVVETGEVPRSDASPEGELAGRKLRQRPAQPREEEALTR